jgi:hypothetical protein
VPDTVQQRLACFMPFLEVKTPFREFHEVARPDKSAKQALGGVRPIDMKSVGNWRNHRARLAGQLAQHGSIQADLVRLGYEIDEAWLSDLEGVVPDFTPSHYSEEPRPASSRRRLGFRFDRRVVRYAVECVLRLR